jgi:methionyl-tRNA formyltransferase
MSAEPDVVLLAKDNEWCRHAATLIKLLFAGRTRVVTGNTDDPFPQFERERYALVVSFLSPWIVPQSLLDRAELAINFHPGTAEYPGIGCYNFALYEKACEYGAICHFMEAKVDTGEVIAERRFTVSPLETVETLKFRTMIIMLDMFHEIIAMIASGKALPKPSIMWSRRPFRRDELNALGRITLDMNAEEIQRRVRAVTYPGFPGVSLEIGGVLFESAVPQRRPIA